MSIYVGHFTIADWESLLGTFLSDWGRLRMGMLGTLLYCLLGKFDNGYTLGTFLYDMEKFQNEYTWGT